MSGSIGGDRIPRSAVQDTVDKYVDQVLSGFEGFKSAKITGSYNAGQKKDHGDIDLAVYIEGNGRDIKRVKKELAEYLESSNITLPFRAGRNKGKKAQVYGGIVTCQVPISGFEGLAVQVDNIVVLSEKDQEFQINFLDADAAKQGLLMGLVRVALLEEDPEKVFKRMGIKKVPELAPNQELEFVLSSQGLSLRKVTLDPDYKEQSREEIWRSNDWQDVEKLLAGGRFDLSKDFDHLLADVSEKVKTPRSRRRIIGIMKSMINVGDGEKGTPKGDAKERAIIKASGTLGTLNEAEKEEKGVIGLYGGGFKPPHKGHYEILKKLLGKVDRVVILIGSGVREGIPIDQDQSKRIWEIYVKASGWSDRVEIRTVQTPVTEIYKIIQNPDLSNYQYRIAKSSEGPEEDKKWKWILKNQKQFPNVKLVTIPVVVDKDSEKLSASDLRSSETKIKKGNWIPKEALDTEDISNVIKIALEQVQVQIMKEAVEKGLARALSDTSLTEGFYGMSSNPGSAISSENREKLGKVYEQLKDTLAAQGFNVIFNGNHIIIKILYPNDVEGVGNQAPGNLYEGEDDTRKDDFDYTLYIADYLKFLKENNKLKIEPLPEIVLDKNKQSGGLLDSTGKYDPEDKVITINAADRHPKDVMRSLSHELVHHAQNLAGKNLNVSTNVLGESAELDNLEREAYGVGNMLFREWTEHLDSHPTFLSEGLLVEQEDFFKKHGIEEEEGECGLGFSEKEQKWYGWSQRAIQGFGIGDEAVECYPNKTVKGAKCKTLADCKKAAKKFSESVS